MAWRYSERTCQPVHPVADHVFHTLYRSGVQIGCGTCAIGTFDDQQVTDISGIDGEPEVCGIRCNGGEENRLIFFRELFSDLVKKSSF